MQARAALAPGISQQAFKCAASGHAAAPPSSVTNSRRPSFDHLVGASEQRERKGEAEALRGIHVDGQLNFCGLLHWQVGRPFALKNATSVDSRLTPGLDCIRRIAHQTAPSRGHPDRIYCRYFVTCSQLDKLGRATYEKCLATYYKPTSLLLYNRRESGFELVSVACIDYQQPHPNFARGVL